MQMKNALLQGRLAEFGALMHASWEHKKRIAAKITTPRIDEMYDEARKLGATGGKLVGAGGGGYLLVFAPFDKRHVILRRLSDMGGQPIDFNFEPQGAVTWRANG